MNRIKKSCIIFFFMNMSFSFTSPQDLAKDVAEFSQIPAAVAIVEHIFTLQNQQQTPANSTTENLCDSTDRCTSTYEINSQKDLAIHAVFSPTTKGYLLRQLWHSTEIGSKPYQLTLKAFREKSTWTNALEAPLGKFFTCTRTSPYADHKCKSNGALTRELFEELKRQHAAKNALKK